MKKILTVLLLMIAVCVQAQHLKFMNIPLDGTIDNFQAKLATKGITPDRALNAKSPVGLRSFKGTFCGYKAEFHAYYNTKTKVVYRCKACISDSNESYITRIYDEIKELLSDKYDYSCDKEGKQDGYDSYSMLIMNDGDEYCDWDTSLGIIDLYISEYEYLLDKEYTLHIDYTDRRNHEKNQDVKSTDL